MSEADSLYILRPYKKEDLNFIQNSWGASYYKGAEYNEFLSPKEFNSKHRPIREEILLKPNSAVIVACNKKDEDLILGWVLVELPLSSAEIPTTKGIILHYIYIKQTFKGEGIANTLLKEALKQKPIKVTHMTDRAQKIIRKKASFFKDYQYAKDPIMLRDKYLTALPLGE